jgi:hypothetical protein
MLPAGMRMSWSKIGLLSASAGNKLDVIADRRT